MRLIQGFSVNAVPMCVGDDDAEVDRGHTKSPTNLTFVESSTIYLTGPSALLAFKNSQNHVPMNSCF